MRARLSKKLIVRNRISYIQETMEGQTKGYKESKDFKQGIEEARLL